ncbi:LysR family transcriptional regulator [Allopusillimonas soli]|uniref:LysR family transcriptional regulator n=1 Tax=Allopusillimonas soli TaxID=659016 RepID=A0A853F740_9BURK|nr:LysR family transcriptional regulator [Allopusillimonas soli]NYT35352.1 LysR family transcriptional regulator [Allopusillimonas soli]
MNLRQLEYFIQVADVGSFTKAAMLLDVAQPALSRSIRSLEAELHQNLLYRNGRGVSPTEAGKRLLTHGRVVLTQLERARQAVEAIRDTPVGRVVIGVPHSIGRIIIAPFVTHFTKAFPDATICITAGLTVHLHEWLLSGRIDIALLHDPSPSPALEIIPLSEDDLFLIGRKQGQPGRSRTTVPLKALADMPLIIPSRPHPLRMLIETRLANLGRKPTIRLEIDTVSGIVELVMQGFGNAVVTANALLIAEDAAKLSARRIVSPGLTSILALGISAERPMTTLVSSSISLLQAFLPTVLVAPNTKTRKR